MMMMMIMMNGVMMIVIGTLISVKVTRAEGNELSLPVGPPLFNGIQYHQPRSIIKDYDVRRFLKNERRPREILNTNKEEEGRNDIIKERKRKEKGETHKLENNGKDRRGNSSAKKQRHDVRRQEENEKKKREKRQKVRTRKEKTKKSQEKLKKEKRSKRKSEVQKKKNDREEKERKLMNKNKEKIAKSKISENKTKYKKSHWKKQQVSNGRGQRNKKRNKKNKKKSKKTAGKHDNEDNERNETRKTKAQKPKKNKNIKDKIGKTKGKKEKKKYGMISTTKKMRKPQTDNERKRPLTRLNGELTVSSAQCDQTIDLDYGDSALLFSVNDKTKVNCNQIFKSPPNTTINFSCMQFNLNSNGCSNERMLVFPGLNGRKKSKFCTMETPSLTTQNNSLEIRYKRKRVTTGECSGGYVCSVTVIGEIPTTSPTSNVPSAVTGLPVNVDGIILTTPTLTIPPNVTLISPVLLPRPPVAPILLPVNPSAPPLLIQIPLTTLVPSSNTPKTLAPTAEPSTPLVIISNPPISLSPTTHAAVSNFTTTLKPTTLVPAVNVTTPLMPNNTNPETVFTSSSSPTETKQSPTTHPTTVPSGPTSPKINPTGTTTEANLTLPTLSTKTPLEATLSPSLNKTATSTNTTPLTSNTPITTSVPTVNSSTIFISLPTTKSTSTSATHKQTTPVTTASTTREQSVTSTTTLQLSPTTTASISGNTTQITTNAASSGPTLAPVARLFCDSDCGKSTITVSRIVGGQVASISEYPWQVLVKIYIFGLSSHLTCGGSIIKKSWILTAAHCFTNPSTLAPFAITHVIVVVREHDLDKTTEVSSFEVKPTQLNIHPLYKKNPNQRDSEEHDIALLYLEKELSFGPGVLPICMPTAKDFSAGQEVIVTGWGVTAHNGAEAGILQEVALKTLSYKECQTRNNNAPETYFISENMICALGDKKDACQGDSGGPLITQSSDGRWVQLGIVSFGYKCAVAGVPGFYTNLANYVDWITEKTNSAGC